jgi:DNA-binding IclR family transcriptional regulator
MANSSPKYTAPALDKGLDILEVLANADQPMSLNALAKAMGRTVSEIFRMAVTLEQRGYLILDDNDRYSLSCRTGNNRSGLWWPRQRP